MLDRFEFLAGRLGSADAATLEVTDLAELRAAINVQRLREASERLPPGPAATVTAALQAVAGQIRGRITEAAVLTRLDAALAATMPGRDPASRAAALALSGLRRALYPAAGAPALGPAPAPLGQAA